MGGRLFDGERLGKDSGRCGRSNLARVKPLSGIPPGGPGACSLRGMTGGSSSDGRSIEKLLPPNSTVLYRTPTPWEEHRRLILSVITVGGLQALLISGLVINLFRRRRAESSLGESEKRFQTVADATPVLLWMTGEDQGCTFFNKAWLEFTGRSMEQELGRGWRESVHPDDLHKATQSHADVFAARKPFTTQYRLRRHDGRVPLGDRSWDAALRTAREPSAAMSGPAWTSRICCKRSRSCMRARSESRLRPRRQVSGCGSLTRRRRNSGPRTSGVSCSALDRTRR